MQTLVIVLCLAALTGCVDPAINVTKTPDVAAVRIQNVETQKQITKTGAHLRKWRKHSDAAEQENQKADDKMQSVKNDLETLLGQKISPPSPSPLPIASATPSVVPAP